MSIRGAVKSGLYSKELWEQYVTSRIWNSNWASTWHTTLRPSSCPAPGRATGVEEAGRTAVTLLPQFLCLQRGKSPQLMWVSSHAASLPLVLNNLILGSSTFEEMSHKESIRNVNDKSIWLQKLNQLLQWKTIVMKLERLLCITVFKEKEIPSSVLETTYLGTWSAFNKTQLFTVFGVT